MAHLLWKKNELMFCFRFIVIIIVVVSQHIVAQTLCGQYQRGSKPPRSSLTRLLCCQPVDTWSDEENKDESDLYLDKAKRATNTLF